MSSRVLVAVTALGVALGAGMALPSIVSGAEDTQGCERVAASAHPSGRGDLLLGQAAGLEQFDEAVAGDLVLEGFTVRVCRPTPSERRRPAAAAAYRAPVVRSALGGEWR
jgi:hypothetical protein